MILIAGGAGYIGSHTNKLLNQQGYKTVVFDNLITGHREFIKCGEFVLGDLGNKEQIRLCFNQYKIKAVMHFSAFAYVEESILNPTKYYQNNVLNTMNLLDIMREFGIQYFVFSSSCSVYGIPVSLPIKEDHPRSPISPYGKSKFFIEEILKDYDKAYGIKYINLRYFNAAGADPEGEIGELHEPETHIIPSTIYAALGKNDNVKIFGTDYPTKDGTCIRDYIHVVDLADAHIKALNYLVATNKSNSFNLGNNNGYSVREIIQIVRKISGKNFKIVEKERRSGDPPILISDSKRAVNRFDWIPKFPHLETIIEHAWNWYNNLHS